MKSKKTNTKLKKNKKPAVLSHPPKIYEITAENNMLNKTQKELSEGSFYEIPDMGADISIIAEKLTRNRKHYLNELEKNARDETIQHLTQLKKKQIKSSVEDFNIGQDMLEIMRKRHIWKSSFILYDQSLPKVCKVETCTNFCTNESDFCINHITNDPSNKLFIECPKCHRIHLKDIPCII